MSCKKVSNTKMHLTVDTDGMQSRAIVTEGAIADCLYAKHLIENFEAAVVIADCG